MAFLIGLPHTGTLARLTKPDPCGYGQQSDCERQIVEQISPVKASWLTEEPERPFQTGRHGAAHRRQAGFDEAAGIRRHAEMVAWPAGGSPDRLSVGKVILGASLPRAAGCFQTRMRTRRLSFAMGQR